MWKYQQTNDMFIKHSNDELYHSDVYLGKEFSDGIKHWKYIAKEKINDHWRYFYSDAEYNAAKLKYKLAKEANELAINNVNNKYKNMEKAGGAKRDNKYDKNVEKAANSYVKAYDFQKKVGKKYWDAKINYMKVSIETFPRRTIRQGKVFLANFLSSANKTLNSPSSILRKAAYDNVKNGYRITSSKGGAFASTGWSLR